MSATTSIPPVIEMCGADVGAMRDQTLTVVADVNWAVAPGEFWVVAGQQQSGKSDLLMLAAGLMTPVRGSCRVFGCDTRRRSRSGCAWVWCLPVVSCSIR